MNDTVYDELADWLVSTFRAQPGVKSPELMEILKFQYTPEEARLALDMGPEGGTMDALVVKTGMPKGKMKALIKSMEKKGTLYTEPGKADPVYWPIGMEALGIIETVGWGENSSPFKKRLNELWHEFRPIYVGEGVAALGKTSMVFCNVNELPEDATPEENLFTQIKVFYESNPCIAVSSCPCRVMDKHGKNADPRCDCIMECCFSFGDMARWAIENDWGREVTVEECFEIIKKCNEKGQVNTGAPGLIICNCCKHACIQFYTLKLGKDHVFFNNHFYASCHEDACEACGTCAERCPVGAITLDSAAVIDLVKCLGCGSCAAGCPERAIKMVRRSAEEIAELDAKAMMGITNVLSKVSPNWTFGT